MDQHNSICKVTHSHYPMSSLKRADLFVVSAIDTRIRRVFNDAAHLSHPTEVTGPGDSLPLRLCRVDIHDCRRWFYVLFRGKRSNNPNFTVTAVLC